MKPDDPKEKEAPLVDDQGRPVSDRAWEGKATIPPDYYQPHPQEGGKIGQPYSS